MFTSATRRAVAEESSAALPPEEGRGVGVGTGTITGIDTGEGVGSGTGFFTGGDTTFFGGVVVGVSIFGPRLDGGIDGSEKPGSTESVDEAVFVLGA